MRSHFVKSGVASLAVLHTCNRTLNTEAEMVEVPVTQERQAESVGGIETATVVESFGMLIEKQIKNVYVEDIFEDEEGPITIRGVSADEVVYFGPNTDVGAAVELEINTDTLKAVETVVASDDANHAVMLRRVDGRDMRSSKSDQFRAQIRKKYNNALVGNDITNAQAVAGYIASRSVFLKNCREEDLQFDGSPDWITGINVSMHGAASTPFLSDTTQLAGAGAGYLLGSAGAADTADWQPSGWALIEKEAADAASLLISTDADVLMPNSVATNGTKLFVSYEQPLGAGGGVKRFDMDGTNGLLLLSGNRINFCTFKTQANKVVYFDDITGEIRKCDDDGTNDALILAVVDVDWIGASTVNDFIYYHEAVDNTIRRVDMDGSGDALVYTLTGDFNGAAYEPVNDGIFLLEDTAIKHMREDGANILSICTVSGVAPKGLCFNPYISTFYCGDDVSTDTLYRVLMTGAATEIYALPAGADVRGFVGMLNYWPEGNIYLPSLDGVNDKVYKVPTYTIREVVYYSYILENGSLNVTQRSLLGTTASAGAATDTIRQIAPFLLKYETPTSGYILTEPASETTLAPISPMIPLHYFYQGQGLWMGNLAPEEQMGLWIRKIISTSISGVAAINGIKGNARVELNLRIRFKVGGVQYTRNTFGLFRIKHDATAGYFLYEGIAGAEPTFGTESFYDTSATLPFDYLPTLQPGGLEYRYVCRYRNAYGLMSQNIWSKRFKLDEFGVEELVPPSAPLRADVSAGVNGLLSVFVEYSGRQDDDPADKVRVYWRNDATAASDSDEYVEADLEATSVASLRPGLSYALVELGPFPKYTDVTMYCVTRRDSDGVNSLTGVALTAEIGNMYVPNVKPRLTLGEQPQHLDPGYFAEVTQVLWDTGGNEFRFTMKSGVSILEFFGVGEILRLRHDSADPFDTFANSIQTAFALRTKDMPVDYPGAQAVSPFNFSAAGGFFTLGQMQFAANGNTRLTFDLDATQLDGHMYLSAFRHWTTQVIPDITPDGSGIQEVGYYLMFPVWDRATRRFVNVMALGPDGVLYSKIPYVQIVAGSGSYK